MFHLGVKIPRWMLKAIRKAQMQMQRERPEDVVTRTDAARHALAKGLGAMGIDLENTEAKEESA